MAITIIWTPQAALGLDKVIEYLETKWTEKEILKLQENINHIIGHITFNPDLFPKSETNKNLHKAIVDKNNYLVYRMNNENGFVEIINFTCTKQKHKH